MSNRREFLRRGLAAFFLGLSRDPHGRPMLGAVSLPRAPDAGVWRSRPLKDLTELGASIDVHGFPFAPGFFGDPFPTTKIPFHSSETQYPGGAVPAPDETVDIAIVGGGLSGLTTAYLLRHRHPVLFELHSRFGGVAKGETWMDTSYSMGSAYFIQPDKDSLLERFYRELELDRVYRFSGGGEDPVEIGGSIYPEFWSGAGMTADDQEAFIRYARVVQHYAEESYPDIPFVEGRDNSWILALDKKSLRQDIEERVGLPIPRLLAAGIQGYCYSSFNSSWEAISAAAGWNFIAAEEFGRWVCPGGNAYVADTLWQRLVRAYSNGHLDRLRAGTRVVEVRVDDDDHMRVVYLTPDGEFRSLRARRVVMACSKHICKHVMTNLQQLDPPKYEAMQQVHTNSYVVVNVLLKKPVALDFYDLFLIGQGGFPLTEPQVSLHHRVIDVVSGHYASATAKERGVLTMYWPLPFAEGLFHLLVDDAWQTFAERLIPELERALAVLSIDRSAVQQVRMTRWGHAMPGARVGFLSDGTVPQLRRTFREKVYFVNQDNWALPAFETCLLEAHAFAPRIEASL
jgi:glycine/D-amino acid oxidase-like deaminating enzyme